MFLPVLAVFVTISASCIADKKAVMNQIADLMTDSVLDEISDRSDEKPEVSAAVKYMIPVPIRVVVPVPIPQQPIQQLPYYPERERYPERDPIVAVPIGLTPGRYGRRPSWRPIGPPVIAVPVGSATRYPSPQPDYEDFERRAFMTPQLIGTVAAARKTRSIKKEFKAEEDEPEELTSDMSSKEVPVIHRPDNPLKVSSKTTQKDSKSSEKRNRPKRQVGVGVGVGGYMYTTQRGSYIRPARVLVPAQPGQVVLTPVAVPRTQVVPVPVYVPVQVDPAF